MLTVVSDSADRDGSGAARSAASSVIDELVGEGARRMLAEAVRALMLMPIIVPSIVHALGFYRMWIDLRLLDTFTGVVLVHVVTGFPYVVITVSTALATFDPRLEQAARNLGASMSQTITLVIVPCIMPGILAGAVFAFVHSWDELVVLLFITSRKLYLLPRAIWAGRGRRRRRRASCRRVRRPTSPRSRPPSPT